MAVVAKADRVRVVEAIELLWDPLPPAVSSRVNKKQRRRSELVILLVRIGERREVYC